ncbi:MAG: hypothetical protein OEM02_12695, partial [Desulfobulbaceae bacterium]|nr:hypothetical protein [Desulfobulbaceae bacterium]
EKCQHFFFRNTTTLQPPWPLKKWIIQFRNLSNWLSGLSILCDYLASNSSFFKPLSKPMPLEQYFKSVALPAAQRATSTTGTLQILPQKTSVPLNQTYFNNPLPYKERSHLATELTTN